ncbi:MAG TPA: elongation factor G [Pirellulales bacterium]|nr:elongation factor G [Pirellulales bacterium]
MSQNKVQDIRNIVFCGHGLAGKTTLTDAILTATGAIKRHGSVDDGTSICDFDDEEKIHHHSIESTLVHFSHAGKHFNLIDTPGYPDFIAQVLGAMQAVDTAVMVIDAHAGLGVNTRRVFLEAGARGLGRMIVINKMDAENVDYPALLGTIRELFGHACIPINVPVGHGPNFKGVVSVLNPPDKAEGALVDPHSIHDSLVEAVVEVDDAVTERYFEGQLPTSEELARLLVEAIAAGSLIPVMAVSAKTGAGLNELLDVLAQGSLPPDKIAHMAANEAGQQVAVKSDPSGPIVAQVFKTRIDPFVHKLSFIRIFSGTLKKDDSVHVSGARKAVKLHQLLEVQANETKPIEQASAGEIVAVAKVDELHTGLSLGDVVLPAIKFPTPMVGLAVTPKSRGDEGKLSGALHKIVEEDSTIQLHRDSQTHELVMNGMSELHLLMVRERLKRRDKVEVDTKEPKIPYRETIQATAEGSYRHKKQSGGRGQFGEVHIRVFPVPSDMKPEDFCTKDRFAHMREFHYDPQHNFLWVDSIVGGTIPNNFLPAVEKGFKERLDRGVIAGFQIQNVGVEVFFGKHHPVDSSEAAFKTAGSMAFRNVFQQAKPGILEPIVTLHVTVPGGKLGDISSDMSGRRGRVLGMDSAGGDMQTVSAVVPLAEVTTYARSLSSITGGQGSYTMEFSHYDLVPGNVQKEIVDKAVLKEEEEE